MMRLRHLLVCLLAFTIKVAAADHTIEHGGLTIRLRNVSESMTKSLEEVITDQLDQSADAEPSPALADDLAFFARRDYQSQGYLKATVAWTLEGNAMVLTATEGMQQHVGKTTFPGHPGLDESELRRYLLRPTRERIGRTARETPYVEKEIAAGLDLVHRYVLSQGYVDALVDPPVATHKDDGSTDVSVVIKPGEQWKVGEVSVVDAPATVENSVHFAASTLRDQTLNEARVENVRRQIEGEVQSRGWFVAKVTTTSTRREGQRMDIVFTVIAGPIHHVEQIEIDPSFSKGATRLVRSAFRPTIGHPFDSQRMELAYGRIVDTGMFEHLDMDPRPDNGALSLHFTGEQAKRSSVGVSVGFDTFLGGILGLEYKNVNFWDSGGTMRVKAIGTQLGYTAGIQWKNPAWFNSAWALSVDLMPETFTFEGYQRYTGGLRIGLSRNLSRTLSTEVYLTSSVNSVSSDTLTALELGPEDYTLGMGGIALIYEARDNPVSPTRGWFGSARVESGSIAADLSDVSYTRTDFALAWYHPFTPKWRTAVGLHWSSVISGEDVGYIPIELRSYNGGAKGVRSFGERRLGPIAADDTPLGGTQAQTLSGELSYEIIKNLEIAGFVDAGSLSLEQGRWLPDFSDIRYAAGIGLRYRLPFGPLRIDYGLNLNAKEGEDPGALHIGFGFAF
jgi:outer membrane protein assembly complex protein YaeT